MDFDLVTKRVYCFLQITCGVDVICNVADPVSVPLCAIHSVDSA